MSIYLLVDYIFANRELALYRGHHDLCDVFQVSYDRDLAPAFTKHDEMKTGLVETPRLSTDLATELPE